MTPKLRIYMNTDYNTDKYTEIFLAISNNITINTSTEFYILYMPPWVSNVHCMYDFPILPIVTVSLCHILQKRAISLYNLITSLTILNAWWALYLHSQWAVVVSSRELSVKEVLRIHEEEQFQLSEFADQLTERLYRRAWDDKHSTERCWAALQTC